MLKKVLKISIAFVGLNLLFLLGLVLFPTVSYAHHTELQEVVIHHNEPLPDHFLASVEASLERVRQVEIFRSMPPIEICVNDGAIYPKIKLYQHLVRIS